MTRSRAEPPRPTDTAFLPPKGSKERGLLDALVRLVDKSYGEQIDRRVQALRRGENEAGFDPFGFDPDTARYALSLIVFLHRTYFRSEVFGIENVPDGRCLLISNHSGMLPLDGVLICGALVLDREPPVLARAMVEKWTQQLPYVAMLFARIGQILGAPDNARRLLEIALKNGERLSRLINDILDIEKIESGRMAFDQKVVDLGALVEHVVEANRPYGREFGVAYVLANDAPGARVEADPDRLIQALTNLLSNAAKFSPSDSVVRVNVRRVGAAIQIEVQDCGRGIPEAFRPRLFQKFAQADASDTRRRGGTGLGLSITKAIVEKLGGSIGFETDMGRGTVFYLDLPEWFEPMGGF